MTLNIAVPRKSSWESINLYCVNKVRGVRPTPTGRFLDRINPANALQTLGALLDDHVDGDITQHVPPRLVSSVSL